MKIIPSEICQWNDWVDDMQGDSDERSVNQHNGCLLILSGVAYRINKKGLPKQSLVKRLDKVGLIVAFQMLDYLIAKLTGG